eukprot:COSAG01_NODE_1134_length_11558_cov_8.381360_8_plen_228_part_00
MSTPRLDATAVALGDGRVLVAGGVNDDDIDLASAEVLAEDGSSWSAVAPMRAARYGAVGGLLPGGRVIVAGGSGWDDDGEDYLATAQLWDPETDVWTELPPMTKGRSQPAGCVLPDGRFVVVGGFMSDGRHRGGEVYDCARNEWTPLPASIGDIGMVGGGRLGAALVPVAGGVLILGGDAADSAKGELWDEESRRWLELPHRMDTTCSFAAAVSVPVGALCKAPATS